MNFNKYRSKRQDEFLKNSPHLYGYDIKKLSKEQSLNYVKEYISEYIGESIFRESNTSIKNKEYIKNIFKYRPKNEHKDIEELIDSLIPKRKKNIKQHQTSNEKNKKIWLLLLLPIVIFLMIRVPQVIEQNKERDEAREKFYEENGGEVKITYDEYGLIYVDEDGYFAETDKKLKYIKSYTHPTIKDTKIICNHPGYMPDRAVPIEFYDSRDGTSASNLGGFDYRSYIGVCTYSRADTGDNFELLLSTLKSIVNACGTGPKSYCIEDLRDKGIIE